MIVEEAQLPAEVVGRDQTGVSRFRPRRRRRRIDSRPLRVRIRARNPCVRTFFRLLFRRLFFTSRPLTECGGILSGREGFVKPKAAEGAIR